MKIQSSHRVLAGALLAATGLGLAAAPAIAATNSTISPASSPRAKVIGQGINSGLGSSTNPSSAASNWTLVESSSFAGTYLIRQKDPLGSGKNLYVDISGGSSTAAGMPIVTRVFDGTSSQHWRLVKVSSGRYTVQNNHSKKFLTFTPNGGSVPLRQQSRSSTAGEQRFDLPGKP
ncbi:RICIN domain-containing protein [Kribbella sp. CA-294648]|uniref:RICIN domain-containing protein n=1 Tax=Kribbella sp. CA-294648 TaxID=3239948 RepID=UPI003D8CBC5F